MSEPPLLHHRAQLHEALDRTALLLRLDAFPGLGADRDAELVDVLRSVGVRVVADRANLASPNGQTALVTLVCQCAMLGLRIDLDVPDARQLVPQPPLDANLPLGSALAAWTNALFPGCLSRVAAPLLTFAIGDTATIRATEPAVYVTGAEDVAALAGDRTGATRWHGIGPWGPIGAGAAAAAEAMRAAIPTLAAQLGQPLSRDITWKPRLFTPLRRQVPGPNGRPVGPVDVVSAGAITHATLYTLLRVPDFAADLRTIDPDILTRSNTNRYPLARAADIELPKVDQLAEFATDAVRIRGVRRRLNEDTLAAFGDLAPRVLLGVDDIPTRWFVQRQKPTWVGVGATSHAFVVVSDHLPGHPCAGCVHPLDDGNPLEEIPTIGFVSLWAGLLLAGTLLAPDAATRPGTHRIEAHPMGLYGPDAVKLLPQVHNARCPVCGPQTSAA
jgi:ThiF family